MFPSQWWIILLVALALNSVGFKKYVWFMTIGYGLSIGGIGFCLIVMSVVRGDFSGLYLTMCLILMVYGLRLGVFLLLRELRNSETNRKLVENFEKKVSLTGLVSMWIIDSLLYYAMMSPMFYRLANGDCRLSDPGISVGIIFAVLGVAIEVVAEVQKYTQKRTNPGLPAMDGIYKMCRCPDYFGEILVWTGVFATGVSTIHGAQWVMAFIGYIGIVYMMVNGARRIELQHIRHYGRLREYREYANKTPILIPLLPVYHLVRMPRKQPRKIEHKIDRKMEKEA